MRRATTATFVSRPSGRVLGSVAALVLAATSAGAGDLVRGVRFKLSAGDLASGEAAVEDYKLAKGSDAEYLDALGWLARGAQMLGRADLASAYVAQIRREIPEETPELVIPLGAAIEVEGKLRAAREGRGSALRFLGGELGRAKDVALRSRIWKNINLLSLEGQPAPELAYADSAGTTTPRLADLKGTPVLLFLWAHGCGDCKGQARSLVSLYREYHPLGLEVIAPTRIYGYTVDGKAPSPAEEKAAIRKVWAETYAGLEAVPIPVDTETMVRYGVSATPTIVLIDRRGIVHSYAPTRLSEALLSSRIEELLAETP